MDTEATELNQLPLSCQLSIPAIIHSKPWLQQDSYLTTVYSPM